MRREGGQVGNPSSQPGKERRGKEGGEDEKDGRRRRCMDQEEKEGATTTKQICPPPSSFPFGEKDSRRDGRGRRKKALLLFLLACPFFPCMWPRKEDMSVGKGKT